MTTVLDSPVAPIISHDRWTIKEMVLTREKIKALWDQMQQYKTLFSDLTRNDFENFYAALMQPRTLWFELWEGEELLGILWLNDMELTIDATAHMVFFDRKPAEKRAVVMELIKWVFARYPLHRVSVPVPALYHATQRLVERLGMHKEDQWYGFQFEGTKREALLIGGKWNDIRMYGLLRSAVEAWD